jgi:3-methyladenine DNA glycosylase AlkD
MKNTEITARLFEMGEEKYGDFQFALMPGVPRERIIGVRTPLLRKYAEEIYGTDMAKSFLSSLPHEYYEENNLHAFLLERIKDFASAAEAVDDFLPYVDNWATCDSLSPRAFKGREEELLDKIDVWLCSGSTYTVRFGIVMLMKHFLGVNFSEDILARVARIRSEEYYINMAAAWFFAEALSKQYDAAVKYIEEKRLPVWVHNKAVQKACESLKISGECKRYLRAMKIK